MNGGIIMNNNVFEKGISFLASGSEAWKMGDEFFNATLNQDYKITREQLHDIQVQEGLSAHWYGKLICLGIYRDGCPVYTFSSAEKHEETQPDTCYVELIRNALIDECGYSEKEVDEYLNSALKKRKS